MPLLSVATRLPVPPAVAYALHTDVRNLPRLMPPGVRVRYAAVPTSTGDTQVIGVGFGRWQREWVGVIEALEPDRLMIDRLVRGPFRSFQHMHLFVPDGAGCTLIDVVAFRYFGGALGEALDRALVAPALRALFAYRHARTRRLLTGRAGVHPAPTDRTTLVVGDPV